MKTWYRSGTALCLAAGLLLTACTPALRLPNPFAAVQQITCKAIPIGVVIGADGIPAAQDQQEGYDLAAQQINQAGGIQGCPIRLVYNRTEGDGTNPDAVQAAMLELADGGQVAVLGATSSAATKRIAAISQYIKMPVVITPDTSDDLMANGSAWIFRINPAESSYASTAFDMVKDTLGPAARVAILYDQSEFGTSASGTAGNAALNHGLTLGLFLGYSLASTDFTTLLNQVRGASPDVLYLISTDPKQARGILSEIASQGLKIPLVIGNGSGFTSHDFLYDASGKLNAGLNGLAMTVPWSADLKGRANPDFIQRLAAWRKATHATAVAPAALGTVQAYTALQLVCAAILETAKASPHNWNAILANRDQLDAYRGELDQTLRGFKAAQHPSLLGPVEFDAQGQNRAGAVIVQALNGSLAAVYPQADATQSLVLSGR